MQITQQFTNSLGLKKTLDYVMQLLFISVNMFSSLENTSDVLSFKINEDDQFTEIERSHILTYMLNIIEYLTHERVQLIQDPDDANRFFVKGGL